MILAPNISSSLRASSMGEPNMLLLTSLFVKPRASVAMSFTNDPQMGIICERFSGSAVATLNTMTFTVRTASLR